MRRIADSIPWAPWAFIDDEGTAVTQMPVAEFMVVTDTQVTILRMLGLRPPLYPTSSRPR